MMEETDKIKEKDIDVECYICDKNYLDIAAKFRTNIAINQIVIGSESFWVCDYCFEDLKDKLINMISSIRTKYLEEK